MGASGGRWQLCLRFAQSDKNLRIHGQCGRTGKRIAVRPRRKRLLPVVLELGWEGSHCWVLDDADVDCGIECGGLWGAFVECGGKACLVGRALATFQPKFVTKHF